MSNIITSKTRRYFSEKPPLGSQIDWGNSLSQGLVGCWLMNEGGGNVVKDIARSNNGTLTGSWVATLKEQSPYFNGSTDINCGNNSSLNLINAITILAWVSIDSFAPTVGQSIVAKDKDTGGRAYTLYFNSEKTHKFFINGGSDNNIITGQIYTTYVGIYRQIAATWNGSTKKMNLYVNAVKNATEVTTDSSTINSATANLRIGNWEYSGVELHLIGKIPLVMIYNRALSPSEIQSLYIAPYQMIAARRRIQIYNISAGGTTNVTVNVTKSSITITALSPTVSAIKNVTVSPSAASITISAISPTVSTAQDVTVNTTLSTVKISAVSPTITAVKNVTVTVTPASITIKALSPVVDVAGNVTVNASLSRISIVCPAVTVTTTSNATVNVSTASISITAISPVVSVVANRTVNVTISTITIRAISPTVSAQGAASKAGDVVLLSSQIEKTILHNSQIEKTILHESPLH